MFFVGSYFSFSLQYCDTMLNLNYILYHQYQYNPEFKNIPTLFFSMDAAKYIFKVIYILNFSIIFDIFDICLKLLIFDC